MPPSSEDYVREMKAWAKETYPDATDNELCWVMGEFCEDLLSEGFLGTFTRQLRFAFHRGGKRDMASSIRGHLNGFLEGKYGTE